MNRLGEIWRDHLGAWVPALVFFLLNLGAWVYYQAGDFGDQVNRLEQRLKTRQERVATLSQEEQKLALLEEQALHNQARIDELYGVRLSTQRFRLTEIIREVRQLARTAGLEPTSTSYPETTFEDFDLERKGFVFSVSGSYSNLRRFINSLELTDSFITMDSIALSPEGKDSAGRLRINFRISTLFASEDGLPEVSLARPLEDEI